MPMPEFLRSRPVDAACDVDEVERLIPSGVVHVVPFPSNDGKPANGYAARLVFVSERRPYDGRQGVPG